MRAALLAAAALAGTACGPPADAPRIVELRCVDDSACQSREDPFLLEVELTFTDADGDLGEGSVQLFLDRLELGSAMPIGPAFDEAGVARSATTGTVPIDVPLELRDIHAGMTFDVGFELTDAAGHKSNRPGVRFRMELE